MRSAAASKVRTLRLARRYDPRIDLRQRLGGLLPLLRACDDWTNAIDRKSNTHLSAVRFKSRLLALRCDLGAGAPGGRLSTQRSRQPRGEKSKGWSTLVWLRASLWPPLIIEQARDNILALIGGPLYRFRMKIDTETNRQLPVNIRGWIRKRRENEVSLPITANMGLITCQSPSR
jgi:hypothetical protein